MGGKRLQELEFNTCVHTHACTWIPKKKKGNKKTHLSNFSCCHRRVWKKIFHIWAYILKEKTININIITLWNILSFKKEFVKRQKHIEMSNYVFGCYYVIMASSLWNMEIIFCLHPEELNGLRFNLVWLMFMVDRFVLATWESCSQVNIRGLSKRGKKDSMHVFKCPCLVLKHVSDRDLYMNVCKMCFIEQNKN